MTQEISGMAHNTAFVLSLLQTLGRLAERGSSRVMLKLTKRSLPVERLRSLYGLDKAMIGRELGLANLHRDA
jgi:hypothetical protein